MSSDTPTPALVLEAVTRRFRQGPAVLDVLSGCDLTLNPGESVEIDFEILRYT